jgi:hypothetical protein
MARSPVRDTKSCGELQARCGKTVAARVVFAGFGAPDDAEKPGGAMAYAARRGEIIICYAIPASSEGLIKHARAPCGLITARVAAKSAGA